MLDKDKRLQEKIKRVFQPREGHEVNSADSWSVFKIMSEFVEGFKKLNRIGPCVTIFGSARTKPDNEYFKLTEELAYKLTQHGYGVITGGGPGIMEAANMGAKKGGGPSVGINITLPFEQSANLFIDSDKLISFDHFYIRKVMFVKYAQGFIVMPGGFGTLDEFFEAITLIQTEKIARFPIILMSKKYWKGLVDWIKEVMLEREANISPEDLDLFIVCDTADEAVEQINNFYSKYLHAPNF